MTLDAVGGSRGGATRRAGSGPRAGALSGGQALRGQGAALLVRVWTALFSFTAGATEYRFSLFPLGGYLRLLGEDPSEAVPEHDYERALFARPLWQRYAIVVAGPLFNLLLPVGIYFIHYVGQKTLLSPTIGTVIAGLPADKAGLLPGDRVETVDGKFVRYWEELEEIIADSPGKTMRFGIRRGNASEERDVTTATNVRKGPLNLNETVGWIGVSPRFQLPEIGIVDLTSPAAQAGLRTFDYIISVNGSPVSHWAEFDRAVARAGASPAAYHLLARKPFRRALRPRGNPRAGRRRRHSAGRARAERRAELRNRHPVVRAIRLFGRAGQSRGSHRAASRGSAYRARRPAHLALESSAPASGRRTRAHLPRRVGLAGRGSPRGHLQARAALRAGRLPPGGTAPGIRRDQSLRLENGGSGSDRNRFFYALGHALTRTGEIVTFTAQGFFQIVRGEMSPKSLGGPLTIGYAAGVAAEQGLAQYLWLMALLSINIGLLNFLPIPILDGGLLLFFTIELFKRRPPSVRARAITTYMGVVVVVLLVALRAQERRGSLLAAAMTTHAPDARLRHLDPLRAVAVLSSEGDCLATAEKTAAAIRPI